MTKEFHIVPKCQEVRDIGIVSNNAMLTKSTNISPLS